MIYNPTASWDRSEITRLRAELATVRDTLNRRTQSHAALVRTRLACPTCSTLPLEETPGA